VLEKETSIAVAKVRAVRLGVGQAQAPRAESAPSAEPQFAVASAAEEMPKRPVSASADIAFPRFVAQTGALQPSTLQAQAAHLEQTEAVPAPQPVAAPTSRARPSSRVATRGGFEIQIGAFGDAAEAERRMSAARQRARGMLDAYNAVALPINSGSSKLYRARFRGFDSTAANETCSRLKSMQIDCFVIRAE
jgi:D-alanyl-D-alanine carboxypeptidase